jgi:hypothetical protein
VAVSSAATSANRRRLALALPVVTLATFVALFAASRAIITDRLPAPSTFAPTETPRAEPEDPPARAADLQRSRRRNESRAADPGSGIPIELESSETFRNTTLLIAIRDAGYWCDDVVDATQGADDMPAWRVSCAEARAYIVSLGPSGKLRVDPTPYAEGRPLIDGVELLEPGGALDRDRRLYELVPERLAPQQQR